MIGTRQGHGMMKLSAENVSVIAAQKAADIESKAAAAAVAAAVAAARAAVIASGGIPMAPPPPTSTITVIQPMDLPQLAILDNDGDSFPPGRTGSHTDGLTDGLTVSDGQNPSIVPLIALEGEEKKPDALVTIGVVSFISRIYCGFRFFGVQILFYCCLLFSSTTERPCHLQVKNARKDPASAGMSAMAWGSVLDPLDHSGWTYEGGTYVTI